MCRCGIAIMDATRAISDTIHSMRDTGTPTPNISDPSAIPCDPGYVLIVLMDFVFSMVTILFICFVLCFFTIIIIR